MDKETIKSVITTLKEVLAPMGFSNGHNITIQDPKARVELNGGEVAENILFELEIELLKTVITEE